MENFQNPNDLLVRIDHLRNCLIESGLEKGLCASETLKYSEELDQLILQYQLYIKRAKCV